MSSPNERAVILEAAERFNAKQSLAELEVGKDELRILRGIAAQQPRLFGEFIGQHCPELLPFFETELSQMTEASIIVPASITETPSSEELFGVYYLNRKNPQEPTLFINTYAVARLFNFLSPLFASRIEAGQATPERQIEAASAVATWMSLGTWLFDKLDPRWDADYQRLSQKQQRLIEAARLSGINDFSGLSADVVDTNIIDEKIGNAMITLKPRFVGFLGYTGLGVAMQPYSEFEAPKSGEIRMHQNIYAGFFSEKLHEQPDTITTLDFALANPLSLAQAQELIKRLQACRPTDILE